MGLHLEVGLEDVEESLVNPRELVAVGEEGVVEDAGLAVVGPSAYHALREVGRRRRLEAYA